MFRRTAAVWVALLACAPLGRAAEPVTLAETPAAGECFRYSVELEVTGKIIITLQGSKEGIRIAAKARHIFSEHTLGAADGLSARSARYYEDAVSSAVVDNEKVNRELPDDRRLIVAIRSPDGLFSFSPAGPLTRDELDLVNEHFNPQCLAGLLPGKAVNVGESWPLTTAAAQAACQFDALTRNELIGKLTAVADGKAAFAIQGAAEGTDHGSKVALEINATGTFDLASKRIVELNWKQKDARAQGPVAPESELAATVTLKRQALAEAPKELTDAALANVPKGEVPAAMALLRFADPKGRYALTYPRDWHITGQTDQHLILRLLDKGEYIAQATVLAWKKADPGKHTAVEDFKKAVNATPGWAAGRVLEDSETTTPDGRWTYRLVAEGKADNLTVVQSFCLLAGQQGDQAGLMVAVQPEKVKAVGTRDRDLLNAITFPRKK